LSDRVEYSNEQVGTMMEIIVNLHWDLLREILNNWTNMDTNPSEWNVEKINRAQKLTDDLQELESIIKGVPIS